MRKQLVRFMILTGVALIGGVSTARAQSVMFADIPFEFRTSGAIHQAGRYELRSFDDDQAVEFEAAHQHPTLTRVVTRLEPTPTTRRNDGQLIFYKAGDVIYLAQMWIPGRDGFLFDAPKAKPAAGTTAQIVVPLTTLASLK